MATIKLTIFKAKALKDGRHKIRVAVCHKQETRYIVTHFIIDNISQFKNGQVVKRPDASIINTKLRSMMNELQERLDNIKNQSLYSCRQIKNMLESGTGFKENGYVTYQQACNVLIKNLKEEGRNSYAILISLQCCPFVFGYIYALALFRFKRIHKALVRRDVQSAVVREYHHSGLCAGGLLDEFHRSVIHRNSRTAAPL